MAAAAVAVWPATLPKAPQFPPVSILTPTYNRRKFIPGLIECIKRQTYPKERMEWLVLDDGTESVEDLVLASGLQARYIRSDTKLSIGAKRNRLHAEARGKILVVMDDDDYYMPERVAHAVHMLLGKKADLCGSTRNQLYFTDDRSIWEVGPYTMFGPNHATFGTMAYTRAYALAHPCDETKTYGEEVEFTDTYRSRLVQLDPAKCMVVMCHAGNTYNKDSLRDPERPAVRKTARRLKDFIRDASLRAFYENIDPK
jgi:glycosyltransferase involved in cell wall biosynthesis